MWVATTQAHEVAEVYDVLSQVSYETHEVALAQMSLKHEKM